MKEIAAGDYDLSGKARSGWPDEYNNGTYGQLCKEIYTHFDRHIRKKYGYRINCLRQVPKFALHHYPDFVKNHFLAESLPDENWNLYDNIKSIYKHGFPQIGLQYRAWRGSCLSRRRFDLYFSSRTPYFDERENSAHDSGWW